MLITIFAPSNVHLLEVAGVRDALFEANCKIQSGRPHRVKLVTELGVPTDSASGLKFVPDVGIWEAALPCDILIVERNTYDHRAWPQRKHIASCKPARSFKPGIVAFR